VAFSLLFFTGYSSASDFLSSSPLGNNSADDNADFSFVVWGHPRAGFGQPPLHFEEILELLSELKPDLLILTGDVIEGGLRAYFKNNKKPHSDEVVEVIQKDWDRFDTAIKKLGITYYITPGNHDVYSVQSRDIFYKRYPKVPFAITFKNSRFILLDDMGISNNSMNDDAFKGIAIPFDDKQIQFIRDELSLQAKYRHIFFFMHNTNSWGPAEGFWWKDIHPILRESKTRAVFSANPDYYKYKFSYVIQDGIYYIQSCTFPVGTASQVAKGEASRKALGMQLDNIQYVKVEGDTVKIRTIAVGATSSNARSRRFWEKVDEIDNGGSPLRRVAVKLKSTMFNTPKKILILIPALVSVGFLFGTLFMLMYKRYKK
jgi:hypothetical protein